MIDLHKVQIIKAVESDSVFLTEISFAAKRFWNYPEHYFDLWQDELTITKDYINQNIVYKSILNDSLLGFYSIVENKSDFWSGDIFVKKGFWLEHIFIKPEFHRKGIGRFMIDHAKWISLNYGICSLLIFVDPYAKGFYDNIGANFQYESKSSIPERLIPVYELVI